MRSFAILAVLTLVLGLLAACVSVDSDDSDDVAQDTVAEEPSPTPEPEPTETPEPEPAETPEQEPTETPEPEPTNTPVAVDTDDDADDATDDEVDDSEATDDADNEPTEHVVEIVNPHNFDPMEITIAPGDTVTWVNNSDIPHTATADPELARDEDNVQLPEGADPWNSETLEPGDEFSITLDVPGVYIYFCIPHEALGQVGAIIVDDGEIEVPDNVFDEDDVSEDHDHGDDAGSYN